MDLTQLIVLIISSGGIGAIAGYLTSRKQIEADREKSHLEYTVKMAELDSKIREIQENTKSTMDIQQNEAMLNMFMPMLLKSAEKEISDYAKEEISKARFKGFNSSSK